MEKPNEIKLFEEKKVRTLADSLVRVSVGLETVADIIADLEQVLG